MGSGSISLIQAWGFMAIVTFGAPRSQMRPPVGCCHLVLRVGPEGCAPVLGFPPSPQLCSTLHAPDWLQPKTPRACYWCWTRRGGSWFSRPRLSLRQVLCTRALGVSFVWCSCPSPHHDSQTLPWSLVVVWRGGVLVAPQ